jgi:hypothetical protein
MKAAQKPKLQDASASKASEFLCPLRYLNNLPSIPYDPKFLSIPEDNSKFFKNSVTTLEAEYKHSIHTEADLGISIDLIDPASYKNPSFVFFNVPFFVPPLHLPADAPQTN